MNFLDVVEQYINYENYRKHLNLPIERANDEKYEFIGQGEYNVNFKFIHPITKEQLVLRINTGSQIGLENQIEYEAKALMLLESSNRTPKVLYYDKEKKCIDNGVMVMQFLPGHHLDYDSEYLCAANILSDIHSVPINDEKSKFLLNPKCPIYAILEESFDMFKIYNESDKSIDKTKKHIKKLFESAYSIAKRNEKRIYKKCIINTELNNTNFLINSSDISSDINYLIDFEKAIISDVAQDLGHYLAPTTTFWKTDKFFTENEIELFIDEYVKRIDKRIELYDIYDRVKCYMLVTCIRGITWCAMAYINYMDNKVAIRNESTFCKLKTYLSEEFLNKIEGYLN